MPTFTPEDINCDLYAARHSLEIALIRSLVDDAGDEYFTAVHGAEAIDKTLAEKGLKRYDCAKCLEDEDNYRAEVQAWQP
jgi:hypothetical protein